MPSTVTYQSAARFVAEVSRAIGSDHLADRQRTWSLVALLATSQRSSDASDDLTFFRGVVLHQFLGLRDLNMAANVAGYQLHRDADRLWAAIDGEEDAGTAERAAYEFAVTARYWADYRDKP